MTITLPERRGECRWCRCNDEDACAIDCGWANRAHTLCTACVPLDKAMRHQASRQEIAVFLQESGFL